MLFSSSYFLFLFFPSVLFIYYVFLKKSRVLQNYFLLFCSLFFYAFGEPKFVLIMILSIMLNYTAAIIINKHKENICISKSVLVVSILINLLLLFVFKYVSFTVQTINAILGKNFIVPQIALPIGISFFTFQSISYVIDVYRGNGEVQKNPMNVGLYIAFFPQLIAGPIVRYETVANQIHNRTETFSDFSLGIQRFIMGLSKKVLLSNTLAIVADYSFNAFANPTQYAENISVLSAWAGAIAYTFQIFFDFSGYSDMAIGLGKMFGFHFNENFDYPYISKSVSEFWRRWHISLGTWFKDYVYFPLGGSRVASKSRLMLNLFIVWFLTGVWHGANWTFICWGILYFLLLVFEKNCHFKKRRGIIGHLYTMFFVVIGWIIFRSNNLTNAWFHIKALFGVGMSTIYDAKTLFYVKDNLPFFVAASIFSTPIIPYLKRKFKLFNTTLKCIEWIILLLLFMISISYLIKGTYNPFIYFNF